MPKFFHRRNDMAYTILLLVYVFYVLISTISKSIFSWGYLVLEPVTIGEIHSVADDSTFSIMPSFSNLVNSFSTLSRMWKGTQRCFCAIHTSHSYYLLVLICSFKRKVNRTYLNLLVLISSFKRKVNRSYCTETLRMCLNMVFFTT